MNKPYRIRKKEQTGIPIGFGVELTYLRKECDEYSCLLKMEPGAVVPVRKQVGAEEIIVLEGEVELGEWKLEKGDYYYAPSGLGQKAKTDKGCTLFISSVKGLPYSPKARLKVTE
jgi:hypothetical protein